MRCDLTTGPCACQEVPVDLKEEIARYLVSTKGFSPEEILFDLPLVVEVKGRRLTTKVDLLVQVEGRPAMCVRIREGSVVSRERGAIAAARLIHPDYIVPVCVQTNGEVFAILDALHKKVLGQRREDLPDKETLKDLLSQGLRKLPPEKRTLEEKILYFYEALG